MPEYCVQGNADQDGHIIQERDEPVLIVSYQIVYLAIQRDI